jgi:hypothetical protein
MLSCRNAIESSGSVKPSRARPDETAHGGEKLTDSMVRSSGSSPVSHVTELVVLERLTGYSKSARGSRASVVRATGSTCGSPCQRVVPRTDTKLAEGRVRLRWRTTTVLAVSYPPDYCVGFSAVTAAPRRRKGSRLLLVVFERTPQHAALGSDVACAPEHSSTLVQYHFPN